MTIAINTRLMIKDRLDGIGWFAYQVVTRLIQGHPEHDFHLFFDRPSDFIFDQANVTIHVLGPKARHPVAMIWWMEIPVGRALKKVKADLFLSPDGYMSLRSKVPSLAVIHDINFVHYPKDVPWYVRPFYGKVFPRYARKATRIATVSEFSKQDIVKHYGLNAESVDVVYNGVNAVFTPLLEAKKKEVRMSLTQGQPYFVFVGSLHPRKNISRLLKAFDQSNGVLTHPHKLVIIGDKYYWTPEMQQTLDAMQFKEEVVFAGRLSERELAEAVAASTAMVYVPYFEGFGIPILEAFASEIPLITSNVSSMPEVAKDAALLVDPFDVSAIATAMTRLANDPNLQRQLVEKGTQRLTDFSWDKTAQRVWQSLLNTKR